MHSQRNPSIRPPDIGETLAGVAPLPLDTERVVPMLQWLVGCGHGTLPAPAGGHTLERWRALGAGPLCADAAHAQRCADLTTFGRQSHAECDLQALGELCVHEDARLVRSGRP